MLLNTLVKSKFTNKTSNVLTPQNETIRAHFTVHCPSTSEYYKLIYFRLT